MKDDDATTASDQDITLRDVVIHLGHMEQRLSSRIDGIEQKIGGMEVKMTGMEQKIDANTTAIIDLKRTLTERMNALEEDLTATMHDTIKIRQHVGIAVSAE